MKAQMKYQKILALVSLIIAAATVALALLFCSGVMFDAQKYTTSQGVTDVSGNALDIGADALIEYSQHMNNVLVIMAIVFVVLVATLYITATNKRRNYYITNYISIGAVAVYALVFAIVLIAVSAKCISLAGNIDYAAWYDAYSNVLTAPQYYSESLATPILGIILSIVVIALVAAHALNLLWKIKLMHGEKALLAQSADKEVA